MDRQGFIDFNTRLSPENSGKADSYARAIRIPDEVLPYQSVIDLHGQSLYDICDIAVLEEVLELVKEEVRKLKDEQPNIFDDFGNPKQRSYPLKNFCSAALISLMDYALDLKNFHLFSHDRKIVPILIPTKYKEYTTVFQPSVYNDDIYNPMITGEEHLQELIAKVLEYAGAKQEDGVVDNWLISPYAPTPTIIEAARTLYENHSVEDITRHEADKVSTDTTINYILAVTTTVATSLETKSASL